MSDSSRISPTAHYTGYVWCRHGLSPAELATRTGRLMFDALRLPMKFAARANRGLTLELLLLQRHQIIDYLVSEALSRGCGQVVELAAGLSGRGLRFAARHPELAYVEADLPAMAKEKRSRLARVGPRSAHHHVVDVDALASDGHLSLREAVGPLLDRSRGVVLVTEGLLNYFPRDAVERIWENIAGLMSSHAAGGCYVSDLHLRDEQHQRRLIRGFRALLGTFARGSIHLHFATPTEARGALQAAGFSHKIRFVRPPDVELEVPMPPHHGVRYVNILEARFHQPRLEEDKS